MMPAQPKGEDKMTQAYTVSTVQLVNDQVVADKIGSYPTKSEAMAAAKRAAKTRSDCTIYGPSSLAYHGQDITAVVSW